MSRIPIIVIVTGSKEFEGQNIAQLNTDYINAVSACGGAPFIVAPLKDKERLIEAILNTADGILFSGGGDIEPGIYKEQRSKECNEPDLVRDYFEIELCAKAMERNIPVLGICRGLQVMCVADGGKILQHIENHSRNDAPRSEVANVDIKDGSLLEKIIGAKMLKINSRHHQAVFGETCHLKAVAFCSEDRIIEAMEHRTNMFALGVQWHPESLFERCEGHKRIFESFILACAT